MPARKLMEKLIKAGSKHRDKAIEMTGTVAYLSKAYKKERSIYGASKSVTFGSKEIIYIIVEWEDARFLTSMFDFSEERDEGITVKVRMKDNIEKGDLIQFDAGSIPPDISEQEYIVSGHPYIYEREGYLSKQISMVPYRTGVT